MARQKSNEPRILMRVPVSFRDRVMRAAHRVHMDATVYLEKAKVSYKEVDMEVTRIERKLQKEQFLVSLQERLASEAKLRQEEFDREHAHDKDIKLNAHGFLSDEEEELYNRVILHREDPTVRSKEHIVEPHRTMESSTIDKL